MTLNLTEEDTKLLWKYLKGVTEWEHKGRIYRRTVHLGSYQEQSWYCCHCGRKLSTCIYISGKCRQIKPLLKISCIPKPYPGTEADIAEDIRRWFEYKPKAQHAYSYELMNKAEDIGVEILSDQEVIDYLINDCTPADKIAAFLSVVKEMENE